MYQKRLISVLIVVSVVISFAQVSGFASAAAPDNRVYTHSMWNDVDVVLTTFAYREEMPFTDVPSNAWYYGDVKTAYETGLIDGRSATTFAPAGNLTYAEAVKLAACMHQKYTTGAVTLSNGSPWYQTYVDYAKTNGIISSDYSWNTNATRAGYIEIFAKSLPDSALQQINTVDDGAIPDVPMSHPNAAAIYKLYRAGILEGSDAARSCNPSANIRRSEVAAILTRMMDVTARKHFTLTGGSSTDYSAQEAREILQFWLNGHPMDQPVKLAAGNDEYELHGDEYYLFSTTEFYWMNFLVRKTDGYMYFMYIYDGEEGGTEVIPLDGWYAEYYG